MILWAQQKKNVNEWEIYVLVEDIKDILKLFKNTHASDLNQIFLIWFSSGDKKKKNASSTEFQEWIMSVNQN